MGMSNQSSNPLRSHSKSQTHSQPQSQPQSHSHSQHHSLPQSQSQPPHSRPATPTPYLVDSHCHLHDRELFTPEQAEEFLAAASRNQVRQVIVIGTDPTDSAVAQAFAAAHPDVYWTYGVHPEHAAQISADTLELETKHLYKKIQDLDETEGLSEPLSRGTRSLAQRGLAATTRGDGMVERVPRKNSQAPASSAVLTPIAIGEIGLDYHYDGYDRVAQLGLFEQMLQLARDLALPVSLHIRGHEAFADAWSVLSNFPELTGVVHSFTGSKQELKRALSRDFYVGVNGLATYSTLPLPPLEKMLLETDAPFLTPVPFRGTINKPGYVRDIAAYLADKLGVATEIIAEQTTKNVRELFNLRDPILPEAE